MRCLARHVQYTYYQEPTKGYGVVTMEGRFSVRHPRHIYLRGRHQQRYWLAGRSLKWGDSWRGRQKNVVSLAAGFRINR